MSVFAIVGSRTFVNYNLFCEVLQKAVGVWGMPTEVVSGGAAGADSLAKRWATEHSLPCRELLPEWSRYGKAAGPMRNTQIIDYATHVIAFPSHGGRGTQDSIRKAAGKPLIVHWID